MTAQEGNTNQRQKLGCIVFFVIIGAVIYLFGGCDGCSNEVSTGEAQIMAKEFVKNSLKSPSTADFSNTSSQELSDKTFLVSGNVDAQNSFGAMLRNTFRVKLKYNGGEWTDSKNWTLIDFNLY